MVEPSPLAVTVPDPAKLCAMSNAEPPDAQKSLVPSQSMTPSRVSWLLASSWTAPPPPDHRGPIHNNFRRPDFGNATFMLTANNYIEEAKRLEVPIWVADSTM